MFFRLVFLILSIFSQTVFAGQAGFAGGTGFAGGAIFESKAESKCQNLFQDIFQKEILALVKKKPQITITQIAEQLELSIGTVKQSIKKLQEEGQLLRKAENKFEYWEIPQKVYLNPKEEKEEEIWDLMRKNRKVTVDQITEALNYLNREELGYIIIKKMGISKISGRWQIPQEMSYRDFQEKRKDRILNLVRKSPDITESEIAKKMGYLPKIAIEQLIRKLKQEGRLSQGVQLLQGVRVSQSVQMDVLDVTEYWTIPEEVQVDVTLTKKEKKEIILDLMKKNQKITIVEMAKETELAKMLITQMIKELKKEGRLLRISGRRGISGYWQIPE